MLGAKKLNQFNYFAQNLHYFGYKSHVFATDLAYSIPSQNYTRKKCFEVPMKCKCCFLSCVNVLPVETVEEVLKREFVNI